MNTTSNAQQFMTQTQIQNRLVNRMISRNTQTALTGFATKESLQDLAAAQALASTFSAGIDRPSRTTWHSKDGLMGKLFGGSDREKEEQKREAEMADLNSLGASSPVSGAAYGPGLAANSRQTASAPSALRYNNAPYDLWASGGYTKVDSSETGNNFDGDLWFGRVGIDHLFSSNLLVGAFGGHDEGDADFTSQNTALDTKASVAGAYFGYLLTPGDTGLPVHLVLDGQVSYSDVDYDLRETDTGTTASFGADRWLAAANLTAVILKQKDGSERPIRWLPKVGVSYTEENQGSYSDSAGTAHGAQDITLGQLTFGTQVFIPILEQSFRNAEFFAKVEGQWDFDDVGQIQRSDGTFYSPGDMGATVGAGLSFGIGKATSLRIEGACESIGRDNYDQYTGLLRLDHYFHTEPVSKPLM
ncbi:MAG: autotransporter outer membrane beta-barrel domain-containing protein [Gammaproteobacteria bacterium]|nr:autotransporter outer membrane beta-barrel domain-containing protein [Gammaproteobacteria bacterium]